MLNFVLLTITPSSSNGMFQVHYTSDAGSALAFAALVAVVMRHTFDRTSFILFCSCLRFWVWFH